MVSAEVMLHGAGIDPSDRAAADAMLAKRRVELEQRYGGGKNPKMLKYYNGQIDFYLENRDKVAELEAENDKLYRKLIGRCQPEAWKLSVKMVK